jgi:SAM-dependent methyltransferase
MEQEGVWGGLAGQPDILEKLAHFREMIPDGVRTVLDVGCGDGALTNPLAEDYDVTGADLSQTALSHVRTKTVLASATDLPFADGAFDLVLCSQVLEHLEDADYRRALSELRRVASRSVLISVPFQEDLALRTVRCPACRHHHHVWGHLRRFSAESLVADVGLPAADTRVFGDLQAPPWPAPLLRLSHAAGGFYTPDGQSPMCPNCGNTDYSATRPLWPPAFAAKVLLDRARRAPRQPFWLAVRFDL